MSNSRLVYSTQTGRACARCEQPAHRCRCKKKPSPEAAQPFPVDGLIRIRRETHGRKGKTVSVIYGLPLPASELEALARLLKQRCGCGGTAQDGVIVIQGDHRQRLLEALEKQGYTVKLAGG